MSSQQSLDAEKTNNDSRQWPRKQVPMALVPIIAIAFFGLQSFFGVTSNPRFESIHTLDVIRLMTSGAAFAVTIMLLVMLFRFSSHKSKS